MSSNAARSTGGRGSKEIESGVAEVGDPERSGLRTPKKKRNGTATDSSTGASVITPSRNATALTTPSRSSRKNKKIYKFDASDLWSSSDDSNDENLPKTGRNNAKAAEEAANQLKRPPLRLVNETLSSKSVKTKSVSSQSSTSSSIRDSNDFEELSQALWSLSVGSGMSAARSTGNDESGEPRSESEPSSFEFPLYGSPTRPGKNGNQNCSLVSVLWQENIYR